MFEPHLPLGVMQASYITCFTFSPASLQQRMCSLGCKAGSHVYSGGANLCLWRMWILFPVWILLPFWCASLKEIKLSVKMSLLRNQTIRNKCRIIFWIYDASHRSFKALTRLCTQPVFIFYVTNLILNLKWSCKQVAVTSRNCKTKKAAAKHWSMNIISPQRANTGFH